MSIEVIVGLAINVKKIKMARICKHITWELEVYSSIICIAHSILCFTFEVMEHTCPDVGDISRFIIQFIAPYLKMICLSAILFHSLAVASYKYYMIVIKRPMSYESKVMERKWLLGLIILPIMVNVLNFILSSVMGAFLLPPSLSCKSNEDVGHVKFFCTVSGDYHFNNNQTLRYIVTKIYCPILTIINIVCNLNILEAFLYFSIFRCMNRYTIHTSYVLFETVSQITNDNINSHSFLDTSSPLQTKILDLQI